MDAILPSSPNWYCSRIIDYSTDGLVCVGAKNSIDIWDVNCASESASVHFIGRIAAHTERIVGLSLCVLAGTQTQRKCCSASEDGKVRVWDVDSKEMLKEHASHKFKLTTVHWSPSGERQLVASGDDKGYVVVWNVMTGETSSWQPESTHTHVFCLTFSPTVDGLLAVGYNTGSVAIVDFTRKTPSVVQRLRGHEDEIHCICWAPIAVSEQFTSESDGSPGSADLSSLIATSSRDKSVRLWNWVKGQTVATLKMPNSGGSYGRQRGEEHYGKARVWTAMCWGSSDQLISTGLNGELILWNLSNLSKPRWQLLATSATSKAHNRIVFSLAAGGNNMSTVISVSMDRLIIVWDLKGLCARQTIPTLGGFVYALCKSPVHPGRLAVGVGDCLIRVWNQESIVNPYDVQTFWQGIRAKVTALCWHPSKENLLAYGTDDGKVGVYDVLSSRQPLISSTYHKRTVYVVCWGPVTCATDTDGGEADDYSLYSVGDGVILQHDVKNINKEAVNIDNIIVNTNSSLKRTMTSSSGRSAMAWNYDYSYVAIGNEDGGIEIYNSPHLRCVCTILVHKKLINCLRWHPAYTAESGSSRSVCSNWLASGSNESVVHVVDLQKPLANAKTGGDTVVVTESLRQLDGHSNRITGLSWSLHQDGFIATASYDRVSQVWDVRRGVLVAAFMGHVGRLLCVEWSATDADVIFTGADDHTVAGWRISQHTWTTGCDKKKLKNKVLSKMKKPPGAVTAAAVGGDISGGSLVDSSSNSTRQVTVDIPASDLVASSDLDQGQVDELLLLLEQKRLLLEKRKSPAKSSSTTTITTTELEAMTERSEEMGSTARKICFNGSNIQTGHKSLVCRLSDDSDIDDDIESLKCLVSATQSTTQQSTQAAKRAEKKKRRAKSLFPVSSMADNRGKVPAQQDCIDLAQTIYSTNVSAGVLSESLSHLGCFVNRRNTYELYRLEELYHRERNNVDQFITLQVLKGCDITPYLLNTSDDKKNFSVVPNDYYIALTGSHCNGTSKDVYVQYAKQLEAEGQFHKASTIYLTVHEVYKAIQVLANNLLYKDAVCLAQVRLSPSDPVFSQLYTSWANHLARDGNFELAAKCLLAVRDAQKAAGCLAKRSELTALRAAIFILVSADHIDSAKVYAQKYVNECLLQRDWSAAAEVINATPAFKVLALSTSVYESLINRLGKLPSLSQCTEPVGSPLHPGTHGSSPLHPGTHGSSPVNAGKSPVIVSASIDSELFLVELLNTWSKTWKVEINDMECVRGLYFQLEQLEHGKQSQPSTAQVLLEMSLHISLGLLQLVLSNVDRAADWFSAAIRRCLDAGVDDVSIGVCCCLLPRGPEHVDELYSVIGGRPSHDAATSLETPDCYLLNCSSNTELSLNITKRRCSAVDALRAYHAVSWIRYQLSQHSAKHRNELTGSKVMGLCRLLLWDTEAERQRYVEELTCIQEAVHQTAVKSRAVQQIATSNDTSTPAIIATAEITTESASSPDVADKSFDVGGESVCSSLPSNWQSQPIDVKYTGDFITTELLNYETQRIHRELEQFTCKIFPHPLQSAELLLQLLKQFETETLGDKGDMLSTELIDINNTVNTPVGVSWCHVVSAAGDHCDTSLFTLVRQWAIKHAYSSYWIHRFTTM